MFLVETTYSQQDDSTKKVMLSVLDSLLQEDQRVRSKKHYKANRIYLNHKTDSSLDISSKKYLSSSELAREWREVDSSNIYSLIIFIEQYGFPSVTRVGHKGYRSSIILMLHFDEDIENKTLGPILKKALLNKEIKALDYARIIDRHLLRTNEQLYYTWNPCIFKKLNSKDKQLVLKNRDAIGLKSTPFKCSTFGKDEIIE